MKGILEKIEMDGLSVVVIILIIIGAIILTRVSRWLLRRFFDRESIQLKVDPTRYKFLRHFATMIVWLVAIGSIIYVIPSLRTFALGLFAGAGIMVAVLGFAAQAAFANIISGIFIVIFKPFRVGDVLQIGNLYSGTVEDITLRHTVIVSFENKWIIMPNSVISAETVINSSISDTRICEFVEIGISYDSDIDLAMKIMREEALAHPNCIDVRTKQEKKNGEEQVRVKVINFGDSSVNLRAWVWAKDLGEAKLMHWDLNKSIKERFDKEGVEIPFPYRTLVFKKDSSQAKELSNGGGN